MNIWICKTPNEIMNNIDESRCILGVSLAKEHDEDCEYELLPMNDYYELVDIQERFNKVVEQNTTEIDNLELELDEARKKVDAMEWLLGTVIRMIANRFMV